VNQNWSRRVARIVNQGYIIFAESLSFFSLLLHIDQINVVVVALFTF
jgi:hypothetical protein